MFHLAMESDDSSNETVFAVITLLLSKQTNKRKKRHYWVHPYNITNLECSSYVVSREPCHHPDKFNSCYRMSLQTFTRLVSVVRSHIFKKDTNFRIALGVEEADNHIKVSKN